MNLGRLGKFVGILLLAGGVTLLAWSACNAGICFEPPYRAAHRVIHHGGTAVRCAIAILMVGTTLVLMRIRIARRET